MIVMCRPHELQCAPNPMLRSPDHVQLVIVHGEPLFFSQRDSPWLPTLRLLHRYPAMMARVQSDTGAVKFVLQGANIMCPGLTSPGADLPVEVPPLPPLRRARPGGSATLRFVHSRRGWSGRAFALLVPDPVSSTLAGMKRQGWRCCYIRPVLLM